ncbi:hypothetical protein SFRURICE_012383 [Spodoptera frugiperda]|nr:hypothetical protein SFRURICE_012383 [Spodoptera frugiperda]
MHATNLKIPSLGLASLAFKNKRVHMIRNNNLWITQRVAPCGIRTRYTIYGSWLPSHCANNAVNFTSYN